MHNACLNQVVTTTAFENTDAEFVVEKHLIRKLLLQANIEQANKNKPTPTTQKKLGETMDQTNTQRNVSWRRALALLLSVGLRLQDAKTQTAKRSVSTK